MASCEKQPIVVFIPIESNLPLMTDADDLSTDQQHLHETCDAVSKGFCSVPLSRRNPSLSRWNPGHIQAIERCVKLVTEASPAVCGVKSRDGLNRSILTTRQFYTSTSKFQKRFAAPNQWKLMVFLYTSRQLLNKFISCNNKLSPLLLSIIKKGKKQCMKKY